MHQPEKWRETTDPFALPLKEFKITAVLGYPHAGNDVFYVEGVHRDRPCRAYIKVERQAGADLKNEAETIALLPFAFVPGVIEYSEGEPRFIVTGEKPGRRLSRIVGENANMESLGYMAEYGRTLALFHSLGLERPRVKPRRFFQLPEHEFFVEHGLQKEERFLLNNPPTGSTECFVHGDFHYANVLWDDGKISCVLDYELSGTSVREFDLAWALALRLGQKFLKTAEERELFFSGYSETQPFSRRAFAYYYLLVCCHFYPMGDGGYQDGIKRITESVISRQLR